MNAKFLRLLRGLIGLQKVLFLLQEGLLYLCLMAVFYGDGRRCLLEKQSTPIVSEWEQRLL